MRRVAEREGFEPSIRLLGIYSLSRRAPSADSAISPLVYRENPFRIFARRKGKSVVFPFLTDRTYSLWPSIRPPFAGGVANKQFTVHGLQFSDKLEPLFLKHIPLKSKGYKLATQLSNVKRQGSLSAALDQSTKIKERRKFNSHMLEFLS